MNTDVHFCYLAQFVLVWELFRTKVVGKFKTHILCSKTFFPENYAVDNNVEKYGAAERPQMTI
jgi:hypothetical protein